MSATTFDSPGPPGAVAASALAEAEVRLTAEMARLHLDAALLPAVTLELSRMLELAARLGEVDVTGVPPTSHAVALVCPLRDDAVGPELLPERMLSAAPAAAGDYFTVPAVLSAAGSDGGHGEEG